MATSPDPPRDSRTTARDTPPCDVCGSAETVWIRCKLVCMHCHTVLMTCGDL